MFLSNSWPTNSCVFFGSVSITMMTARICLSISYESVQWWPLTFKVCLHWEGGRVFHFCVDLRFWAPHPPYFYFRKRNFVSHTERGNFSVYAQCVFNSPKAAAGLPHLSRKKVNALRCQPCLQIVIRGFSDFFKRGVLASEVCVFTTAFFSIYICEDIYMYIYILVLFLWRLRLGALAGVVEKCDTCPLIF